MGPSRSWLVGAVQKDEVSSQQAPSCHPHGMHLAFNRGMPEPAYIVALIRALGSSPPEVAQALQGLGLGGTPLTACNCVICAYLRSRGVPVKMVRPSPGYTECTIHLQDGERIRCDDDTLLGFLEAFDSWRFPDLVR